MDDLEKSKKKIKNIIKNISKVYSQHILSNSATIESKTNKGRLVKLYYVLEDELDEEFHLIVGKNAIDIDPDLVYISIINNKNSARVIVYCGKNSSSIINAGSLAKSASLVLNGSGGGSKNFGQGGGKSIEKLKDIKAVIEKTMAATIG
jgi:alanyl-tRNA synthetase